ncbi:hypothetical protein GQ457_10G017770 [Hibiscus cannabinus]
MTRANPRGPRFDLDPEIERTQKQLKRRIRDLMDVNRNNGQPPADGQNLPAQADGAIAPPAQQMNQQLPARTVRDYLAEDLEGLNPAVTMPDFEAEHFELKPVMFNMLNTLGQFGGTPNENARQHLKSFLEICNSFKIHGVSNDFLKLKLFPYSLRDKAKTTVEQSPVRLASILDPVMSKLPSQEDDEAIHEAWERYRDLFRRCPMHGLPEWTQESIFYNSDNTPTRMMLDASANGTLLDKPPRESLEVLDKVAQNDYKHPTSRRGNTRREPAQLDSSDTILSQIASLTNMISQILSSRPIGGFPSDTEVAKGATHEQCNAITTRSGKILQNNQGETAVKPPPATDPPAGADEPAQASEDHRIPQPTMGESSAEASHDQSDKPEEIRPPHLFHKA